MFAELEEAFGNIAYRAIEKAEQVDCTLDEFRTGLMIMEATIKERINQVKEELDARGEREELD